MMKLLTHLPDMQNKLSNHIHVFFPCFGLRKHMVLHLTAVPGDLHAGTLNYFLSVKQNLIYKIICCPNHDCLDSQI